MLVIETQSSALSPSHAVMGDLPYGPTGGPIRRIELALGYTRNGSSQLGQQHKGHADVWRRARFERANRIPQVRHSKIPDHIVGPLQGPCQSLKLSGLPLRIRLRGLE